ncbi:lipocalin family protein [uncultured Deefgea sp.]|uniref:lipocalin family protein n=1 Tax=uncultured Deefgea sp. TaxID=1304914 RepID=UPI002620EC87|nr:lipocalin family protein [uncultured Deefgea sp.]
MPKLLLIILCSLISSAYAETAPIRSVPQLDVARYLGTWHEIARFAMYFQNQCVGEVTANYTLQDNGDIQVINRCRIANGEFDQAKGRAQVVANTGNAQLKVSFFWPFKSDYWVIGLDPDYRWAVVGNPNRKYLWILSRTPTLSPSDLALAKASAVAQGYSLQQLISSDPASVQP